MMAIYKAAIYLASISMFFLASIPLHGEGSDIDHRVPTFLFTAHGGLSTYKSEMMASNDTAITTDYKIGVYQYILKKRLLFNKRLVVIIKAII